MYSSPYITFDYNLDKNLLKYREFFCLSYHCKMTLTIVLVVLSLDLSSDDLENPGGLLAYRLGLVLCNIVNINTTLHRQCYTIEPEGVSQCSPHPNKCRNSVWGKISVNPIRSVFLFLQIQGDPLIYVGVERWIDLRENQGSWLKVKWPGQCRNCRNWWTGLLRGRDDKEERSLGKKSGVRTEGGRRGVGCESPVPWLGTRKRK